MSRESPPDDRRSRSIVLVMVDQLSARWVEACLAGAAPLPNLARLQARGTTFRNAISRNSVPHTPDHWARTVRTHDWRYTMYPRGGEQLFDLTNDPDEQRNLARDPAYEGVRRDLRDRLLELLIDQDYPHSPRGRFAYGVP